MLVAIVGFVGCDELNFLLKTGITTLMSTILGHLAWESFPENNYEQQPYFFPTPLPLGELEDVS